MDNYVRKKRRDESKRDEMKVKERATIIKDKFLYKLVYEICEISF